jgi:hypothetical protein
MFGRIGRSLKAVQELGLRQTSRYSLYQFGLITGHYRRSLKALAGHTLDPGRFFPIFSPAQPDLILDLLADNKTAVLAEADLILSGKYRPFGGDPTPLDLSFPNPELDWTEWHFPSDQSDKDIKDIWEPNRFGWSVTLARAFHLTGKDKYAEAFWQKFEEFVDLNPCWKGPNWESGQEVGLRLIHWVASGSVFTAAPSSRPERMQSLANQIQIHAFRIPITLVYAKAQNNNHWLSEAAALYTAGACLPDHPNSAKWKALGWREFSQAILQQISEDGTYIQQSTCYHRLMLTLALWMNAIRSDLVFSPGVRQALGLAARWLDELVVGTFGEAPNLGSNDGSLILSFGNQSVTSYREVADSALKAFCSQYPENVSEHAAWFTVRHPDSQVEGNKRTPPFSIQRLDSRTSVGFFRTARFSNRPSHADQLHFDLWWEGENILKDPGTYRYNASVPWDNALAGTESHNTVTVDNRDQMTRAGKFLWTDWAQSEAGESLRIGDGWRGITASHDGYRKHGITHTRVVEWNHFDTWVIRDQISSSSHSRKPHTLRLQWLLPDAFQADHPEESVWKWTATGQTIILTRGDIVVAIHMGIQPESDPVEMSVFRAGKTL